LQQAAAIDPAGTQNLLKIATAQRQLAQPQGAFSGTGLDIQAANVQYQNYRNAGLSEQEARTRSINDVLSGNLYIGNRGGTMMHFNGSIDEVKIWNRALSAQEVNASFNAVLYRLERNFTGLLDGNYTAKAYVVDAAGNINQTEQRQYVVDTTVPTITIVPHTIANATFQNVTHALVNITTSDAGETSAFIDFNNSLLGYWRFEDDGDTNASDFTSYGNDANLTGFGCLTVDCNLTGAAGGVGSGFTSAGKRGRALMFDGVDDVVNVTRNFVKKHSR
ncbi:MAG: hypothetical protein IIB08_04000, partial [Bacteroidetes bacterium]|nr:hypothetical protein [Bacteroidota bacterium]